MEQESSKKNSANNQTLPEKINRPAGKAKKIREKKGGGFFWIMLIAIVFFYFGAAWKSGHPGEDKTQNFISNITNPGEVLQNTSKNQPENTDFGVFWEAWNRINKYYVDEEDLDSQERVYGAVRGMVNALGDPYSGFMTPKETEDFDTEMEGSFEGIGAELGVKEGSLTIISPIDDMPAQKAGLKAGDKIIEVDGESTADMSINEAVRKIRGPKGTEVTLTIVRENGESETEDYAIARDTIELESVVYKKKEDGIGYIRINKFVEDTAREFNREITKAIADGREGIVLDLRNNPGGYLTTSIEIASKFVQKGEVVVWEEMRDGERKAYKALGGANLSELPVVVLINEGSASASEILAGAIRDNKGSKLVGMQSFGKGSVQQLETLSDGSSLRITIAKWLTPSGSSIHEKGLEPDIKIELSDEDIENENDAQLNRAIEELRKELQ